MAELPPRYPSSPLTNESLKTDQNRKKKKGKEKKKKGKEKKTKKRRDICPLPPLPAPESASVPAPSLHSFGRELPATFWFGPRVFARRIRYCRFFLCARGRLLHLLLAICEAHFLKSREIWDGEQGGVMR